MTSVRKKRLSRSSLLIAAGLVAVAVGCGEDFENEPREPVPVELTAVILRDGVTVSPKKIGGGPVSITVSNQTDEAQVVTLVGDGRSVQEKVGPVNPQDTATIQKTLEQGTYELRATPDEGSSDVIKPGTLEVGPAREASNDRILLP